MSATILTALVLLVMEQRDAVPAHAQSWAGNLGTDSLEQRIRPWTPEQAEATPTATKEELAAQRFGECITDKATIEALFKSDAEAEARAEKGLQ